MKTVNTLMMMSGDDCHQRLLALLRQWQETPRALNGFCIITLADDDDYFDVNLAVPASSFEAFRDALLNVAEMMTNEPTLDGGTRGH
jgi:hypothetical protein